MVPATCLAGSIAHDALVRRVNQLYHDLTQDIFDAEHHHRHRAEQAFWINVAQQALASSSASRTVVDLACGTGFVTRLLGRVIRTQDTLIAIDLSTAAMNTTARRWSDDHPNCSGPPRLVCLAGDGQHLPLPPGCVDLLTMNAGLHHVPDPAAALREIDRVLKPGGLFALGFEPNMRHFSSPLVQLSRGFDRLAWYVSPRQNLRRVCQRLGAGNGSGGGIPEREQIAIRQLNRRLMQEGVVAEPLTAEIILDLVDPHARGAESAAGFDAMSLLRQYFGDYQILRLVGSDYLGEAARRSRMFRGCVDAAFRMLWPSRGLLLSWLIRKPERTGSNCSTASATGGDRA